MVNLEYIRTCSKEELVKLLCDLSHCDECAADKYCFIEHAGFIDWLEKERDEE